MSIQKPLTPKQKAQVKAARERYKKQTPAERKRDRQASKPAPWPGVNSVNQ